MVFIYYQQSREYNQKQQWGHAPIHQRKDMNMDTQFLRKFGWTSILIAVVAAVLAGCGKEKQKPPLRIGYQQGSSSTLPMLAKNENYFEQNGIKTDFVLFTSSSDGLNALKSGKLDLGVSFGTCGPLTYIAKGADFVIIAGNLSGGHPIITRAGEGKSIRSVSDFKGKTVGTPRIFTSDVVFRGACAQHGIDLEKDLKLVEFKRPNDVLEAVKSGKVDIGIGASNIIPLALQAGLDIPLWSNDLFPNHPCCRIVATRDAVKNRRQDLVRLLKAELLAEKKFADDPEAAVRAGIEQQMFSEKVARGLILEPHQIFGVDPNRKGVLKMWDFMKKIKYVESDINADSYIDTSIYYDALQELRREKPDPYWENLEKRYHEQNDDSDEIVCH